jgi:Ca2+-binding RTX toxin-like protein
MTAGRLAVLVCAALLATPAAASADATLTASEGLVTLSGDDGEDSIGGGFADGQWSFSTTGSTLSAGNGGCEAHHVAFSSYAGTCTGAKLVARTSAGGADAEGDSFNWNAPATVPVTVTGGSGSDTLSGEGDSSDVITGGTGADQLDAGAGDDTVYGGDSAKAENPASVDEIDCGAGEDTVYADPSDKLTNCEHKVVKRSPNVLGGVVIGSGSLSGGTYALNLTCDQASRCEGKVSLKTREKVKVGRGKAKIRTLGKQKVSLDSQAALPVNIKLSKVGRKLVKKPGKLPAVAFVELTAGAPSRQQLTLP